MARKKPLLHAVTSAPESRAASESPAQRLFQGSWAGHLHATRVALAMIYEHATRGNGALSPDERILTQVCELRCALASGEWLGRLKANSSNELATARFALNEVGAMSVAAYISDTVAALRRACLVQQRDALLAKLERDLYAAGPALDTLIARFAQSLLDAGGCAPEDLPTHSAPGSGDGAHSPAQPLSPACLDSNRSERSGRR
jgi:hypothetical protein